jgi:cell wall-associated NlpC family hydrolase
MAAETGPITGLDPVLNPYRPDLAAIKLKGQVTSARFVAPVAYQVSAGVASLRVSPTADGEQKSQAVHGEVVEIYEERDGFGWGQMLSDGYVGWFDMAALSAPVLPVTAKVSALRTYALSAPSPRAAPHFILSLGAQVIEIDERENGFVRCERCGWVFGGHLARLDAVEPDPVGIAEKFLGAIYQWGGVESLGLDCSGLTQTAWKAAGYRLPRDTYMLREIGEAVEIDDSLGGLKRGDLVLWTGHVAIMLDETRIIHASSANMSVSIETLKDVAERISRQYGAILSVRRIG